MNEPGVAQLNTQRASTIDLGANAVPRRVKELR